MSQNIIKQILQFHLDSYTDMKQIQITEPRETFCCHYVWLFFILTSSQQFHYSSSLHYSCGVPDREMKQITELER